MSIEYTHIYCMSISSIHDSLLYICRLNYSSFTCVLPLVLPISLMQFGGSQSLGGSLHCFHFMRDSCSLLMLVTENYFCMEENKCYFNKRDISLFIDMEKLFRSLV